MCKKNTRLSIVDQTDSNLDVTSRALELRDCGAVFDLLADCWRLGNGMIDCVELMIGMGMSYASCSLAHSALFK